MNVVEVGDSGEINRISERNPETGQVVRTLDGERLPDFGIENHISALSTLEGLLTGQIALETAGRQAPGKVTGSTAAFRAGFEQIDWRGRTEAKDL